MRKGLHVIEDYRIVTKYNNQESAGLWKMTIDIKIL